MDATKPCQFIGFGAMDSTKPYKFIGFGAMDATKPYEFIGFRTGPMVIPIKLMVRLLGEWTRAPEGTPTANDDSFC